MDITVSATCTRVQVRDGHTVCASVSLGEPGTIAEVKEAFRSFGATTHRELYVNDTTVVGAVDLLVEQPHVRIAIEAELSPKRIWADLRKAAAVRADELWIVVPTVQLVRTVRRKLATLPSAPLWLDVFVLTQGQALQRVTNCVSLIAGA